MSLSFGEVIEKSKPIRPLLNIGAGFDIPTGSYRLGKHGESILNGGLAPYTAIVGKGNTFKTAIMMFMMGRVLERYNNSNALHYDTECTFGTDRILSLMSHLEPGTAQSWIDDGRIYLTDDSIAKGNEWFKKTVQDYAGLKQKDRKSMGTLPFVDSNGNLIPYLYPTVNGADSISEMKFNDLEKNYAKMEIGQGEMQTEAMRVSNAKRMLIEKTQGYANGGGLYVIMSAHLGKELNMDGKPQEKKTTFMKQGDKISKVPSQILSLPNNAWEISTGTVLINRDTKEWMYPKPGDVETAGNPDLLTLIAKNLRGKNGPSGVPWEFVMSQSEGLLPSLTEFNHIKNCNRYGLGGNDRNYYVELLPDVKLMRTTVRGKIDETPELRRALEITMEMCQMRYLWHTRDPKYNMTPLELREGLEKKGYKWDQLLNTRGFWTYEEDNHPLPFLSTMDLLRMYHDEYRPFWM
ncbi:hypothetical protein pEaSNUABM37_00154 [Erwinia phage pEa_SNUABM_37]|nr:hypothetical protein pEaSNUABM37_00154 [Erwinia phage pEa_SNUABM_37]QXO10624.1 hypothetical protein pEaSNUABM48_00154 [Erwinia phage pEa_SNUABM_48]